jgi:hypothetical protein
MNDRGVGALFGLTFCAMSALFLWVGIKDDVIFVIAPLLFMVIGFGVFANSALPNSTKKALGSGWVALWHGVTFGLFSGLDAVRNQLHDPVEDPTKEDVSMAREVAELVRAGSIEVILKRKAIWKWRPAIYEAVLIEFWRPKFTADPDLLDELLAEMWLRAPQGTMIRMDMLEHIERHGQQRCVRALMYMDEHGGLERSGGIGRRSDDVQESLEERVELLVGGGGQLSVVRDTSAAGGLSLEQDGDDKELES